MRTNKRPIAIIRRSCSDSSVTASQWIEFSEATGKRRGAAIAFSGLRELHPLCYPSSELFRPALHNCPQAPDLSPPSRDETIAVGVLACVPDTALAERELVLRVHERRGSASSHRVDATCTQHAVGDDLLVLTLTHRAPYLSAKLLADQPPLPHAASP